MIYPPNAVEWKPGDVVIHDDDAKRPDMLMVVLSQIKSGPNKGIYRTRYVNTNGCANRGPMHEYRRTVWKNAVGKLHDPACFGIKVQRATVVSIRPAISNAARSPITIEQPSSRDQS